MSKVLTVCALAMGLLLATVGDGYAGPVQKSPVQAPPAPAAPPAPMARAEGGYRAFSYEPGMTYRPTGRRAGMGRPAYLDARSKALGW
jgi:hypothetical protein